MKGLLLGIAFLVLVALAGFLYRNAMSRPAAPAGVCTAEARLCPDGQGVGREAPDCNFAVCPAPNITLGDGVGIVFALPPGYGSEGLGPSVDPEVIDIYVSSPHSVEPSTGAIEIRRYALTASSSVSELLRSTALSDATGAPVSPSAFSATQLGAYTFSTVVLGRAEGRVHIAYYLPRLGDVLRFDAIDEGVMNWSDPRLSLQGLPANAALRGMLTTMQAN